ncbi:MAG: N-acetyl-gamma-glutamyl-phosphate reductase [Acidimicrobiia bacterium]
MAYRAAVVGASGYTGAETLRLLAGHPDIEVVHVTASSNAGGRVAEMYPGLALAYPDLRYETLDVAALDGIDVVFMGLPHGESQHHAPTLVSRAAHVVDIGADFRLPAPTYQEWYGEAHTAPELLGSFAYGLPELFRDEIRRHPHVANPGCYPTAAALALAPLVAAGLVETTGIVVDAASGLSGRGRGLSAPSLYSEANENMAAYGLLTHRHTAEMEMALSAVSPGSEAQLLFTPHLAPMTRGILATCYARPTGAGLSTAGLLDHYRQFYAGEQFVAVAEAPPSTKATLGGNAAHLTVRFDARTGYVLAIAALDNLVKGASGQAVQNANILLGLGEETGLSALGTTP